METVKKNRSGTTDLTVGRPLAQILRFALPLVLGTLFQQLYSFADTIIVGRCLGTDALGAVGTTYSLNFLILGFIQGACVGFGIPAAESFGAKDHKNLERFLINGAALCIGLSAVFTVVTTLTAPPLLKLIHTPPELFDDASLYIRIIFLGIPATVLYNYSSSVLRAMGDSRHPFYFLLASSLLNIALDWILIVPFGMGVDGAAIATVISQALSGLLCTWWFFSKTAKGHGLSFTKNKLRLSSHHCKKLAYIGLPMGFEYFRFRHWSRYYAGRHQPLGKYCRSRTDRGRKNPPDVHPSHGKRGYGYGNLCRPEPRCRAHRPHPPGYKGRLQNPAVLLRCRLDRHFPVQRFCRRAGAGRRRPGSHCRSAGILKRYEPSVLLPRPLNDLQKYPSGPWIQYAGCYIRHRRAGRTKPWRPSGSNKAGISWHLSGQSHCMGLSHVLLYFYGNTGNEKRTVDPFS